MKTFKTPKGTELPLLDLRGKDYLQVAHRIVWFREERPLWRIQTEVYFTDEQRSIVRASIFDEHGNIMAQGTKSETVKGFADHIEKAETGSIGRALALCGFGTQFAPEFDEGERLADSPLPSVNGPQTNNPENRYEGVSGKESRPVTEPQLKRLYAIVKQSGLTDAKVKEMVQSFGVKDSKSLNQKQYDELCSTIEGYGK